MTVYIAETEGGMKVAGCGAIAYTKYRYIRFAPGDILYNVYKARKGVLEKVVLKNWRVINSDLIGGQFEVIYVDVLNALWNERDLIGYAEALVLAQAYRARMLAYAQQLC
jgi:hypothetical protein